MPGVRPVTPANDLTSDRPLVERCPSEAPDGRSTLLPGTDPATEIQALADLLGRGGQGGCDARHIPWSVALIAEVAMEHECARAALRSEEIGFAPVDADTPPLSTEHVIAQFNQLRGLIGDGHARC